MRVSKQRKLNKAFDILADLIKCSDKCAKECPFDGATYKCPLNQFRDKIESVIEGR